MEFLILIRLESLNLFFYFIYHGMKYTSLYCKGIGEIMTYQTGIGTHSSWISNRVLYQLSYLMLEIQPV